MTERNYRGLMMTPGNYEDIPLMLEDLLERGCFPILKVHPNGLFVLAVPESQKDKLQVGDDGETIIFMVKRKNYGGGHRVIPMSENRILNDPLAYDYP